MNLTLMIVEQNGEELEEIDNYFRVEAVYINYFISGPMKDVGIYYIAKEVI